MAQRLSVNQTRSFGSNKVVAGLAEKTADSKAKHKAHCWRLLKNEQGRSKAHSNKVANKVVAKHTAGACSRKPQILL